MLFDDFIHVFLTCIGIPNSLWINHQYRALVTSVHTAGIIDADPRFACQAQLLDALLGVITHTWGAFISTTRFAVSTLVDTKKQVVLIYSNRQEGDTIFYKQLQLLKQQYSQQFQIHFLFSIFNNIYQSRLSNWLLQHLLKKYLFAEKNKTLFYLCGPFDYMQMANITLLNEGIPLSNIRKENFNALPRIYKPAPPDKDVHTVTIYFENKIHQLAVQYPVTILAAAKAANVAIPYSCEAGRCGSCVATCIKGKIWMAYNEVLMDDEIAKGRILCCQAYPVGGDAEIVV